MEKEIPVYVYGTLRPGNSDPVVIRGTMVNLGHFPGVKLDPDGEATFIAERVMVSPSVLGQLDGYEGYYEESPSNSLYLRVPYEDGWIYEYNRSTEGRELVPDGDWLAYTGREAGSAAKIFGVKEVAAQ